MLHWLHCGHESVIRDEQYLAFRPLPESWMRVERRTPSAEKTSAGASR
jgi:hypothetical protein